MKPKTPASAPEPGVDEAERSVALRNDELNAIRAEIAAAEAALPKLAQSDDDTAFESASLQIDRLKRAELRAAARLEQAREALTEAKASEEQGRRRALFEAGKKAAAEAERLAGEYAEHAGAIVEVLKAIDKLREPIEAANDALPEGGDRIDADHALRINRSVKLPAATSDGAELWYVDYYGFSPLNPRPAILRFSNAVEALPSAQTPRAPAPQPVPQSAQLPNNFGELRPDGVRTYRLPKCEWPLRAESN